MIYYVHEKWYIISSYSLTYFLIWRTCVADPEDRLVYYMRNKWYIVSITCVYNFGFVQQLAWGGVGLWNFSSHLWIIFWVNTFLNISLRTKCPYSELFWSAFFPHFPAFRLNTPNAGTCGKNADQNNSEYGHFLRSIYQKRSVWKFVICAWNK